MIKISPTQWGGRCRQYSFEKEKNEVPELNFLLSNEKKEGFLTF